MPPVVMPKLSTVASWFCDFSRTVKNSILVIGVGFVTDYRPQAMLKSTKSAPTAIHKYC